MLASPFILYQRLADLRPSDEDQRIARWLRDADTAAAPQRVTPESGRRWLGGVRGNAPARLPAR